MQYKKREFENYYVAESGKEYRLDSIPVPEILPPTENGVFQSTFTREGSELALQELLSDIISRHLKNIRIRDREPTMLNYDEKQEVYDINCVAEEDGGTEISINLKTAESQFSLEMQESHMEDDNRRNEHTNIRNRSVYNLSDLHARQAGRGIQYADLCRSYQITLCNYKVFSWQPDIVEMFTYRNAKGSELSDKATAIFIDLTKAKTLARKNVKNMTEIEKWVVFIAKANDPAYRDKINEIIADKEAVHMAYDALTTISRNEEEIARYRRRRIAQMDAEHNLASALKKGKESMQPVIKRKDAKIEKQSAQIKELSTQNKELNTQNKELSSQLKELNTQNKELNTQNKELITQIKEQGIQIQELAEQLKELTAILMKYQSKSGDAE